MSVLTKVVLSICLVFGGVSASHAALLNGDFGTGDFTSWTVEASNLLAVVVDPAPFASIQTQNSDSFAQLTTGPFGSGLGLVSVIQEITVDGAAPILGMDIKTISVTPDATGTGAGPFEDDLFVGLQQGIFFFDLLVLESDGATADPFSTAPGSVMLGAASDSFFDFRLSADLSSLAGQMATLRFDLLTGNDSEIFTIGFDNVAFAAAAINIPEPSTLLVLSGGLVGLGVFARRRRVRHGRSKSGLLLLRPIPA